MERPLQKKDPTVGLEPDPPLADFRPETGALFSLVRGNPGQALLLSA
jgi:hypothetical protein